MMAGTVFLDLDGTLLDTTYLHTVAWWRALDDAGQRRPMAEIHQLIGMGSQELLTALIGMDSPDISRGHDRYFSEMHPFIRSLPGAADLVKRVKEQGSQAVAVTSAKERDLSALLAALGEEDVMDEVIYGEEAPAKPSPALFVVALRRTGADPTQTLGLGDAVWDIEAAGRAGIPCVGVQTGGIDRRKLEEAGAVAVYQDCGEVLASWDESPFARLSDSG